MSELNFESVNEKIEALDLAGLEKSSTSNVDAKGAIAIPFVCEAWKKIGDIVRLIAKFPFLPKKWRQALDFLIKTMDSICPE